MPTNFVCVENDKHENTMMMVLSRVLAPCGFVG
jgi:hypothetical protein